MNVTNAFFVWFFTGLNGLGGWFIFLLLALAGVIWLLYDSSKRHLPALGWRLGAILVALLLFPAMIYRFSSAETQLSLDPFVETIFYLGLLGGILPLVLAVGYYVTYRGLTGCPNGHVYDTALGQCPECQSRQSPPVQVDYRPPYQEPARRQEVYSPPPPARTRTNAWLVSQSGKRYDLYVGDTTIGRHSDNDVCFNEDLSVSKHHAKISEANGHFYIYDVGSSAGTKVNGQRIRQGTLLENNDEIKLGEVVVRFISTTR